MDIAFHIKAANMHVRFFLLLALIVFAQLAMQVAGRCCVLKAVFFVWVDIGEGFFGHQCRFVET